MVVVFDCSGDDWREERERRLLYRLIELNSAISLVLEICRNNVRIQDAGMHEPKCIEGIIDVGLVRESALQKADA